ncbi:uncharacterized protein LOC134272473 [Saccostrea cucullata]|uniref:uncharacterized protein LOC134272473 n=1 Tax=Saccostrea cuccullata TaxID=36930 RepID=UPI002ED0BFEC
MSDAMVRLTTLLTSTSQPKQQQQQQGNQGDLSVVTTSPALTRGVRTGDDDDDDDDVFGDSETKGQLTTLLLCINLVISIFILLCVFISIKDKFKRFRCKAYNNNSSSSNIVWEF